MCEPVSGPPPINKRDLRLFAFAFVAHWGLLAMWCFWPDTAPPPIHWSAALPPFFLGLLWWPVLKLLPLFRG